MQLRSRLTGQQGRALDGFQFSDHRARAKKIPDAPVLDSSLQALGDLLAFGVYGDWQAEPRCFAQTVKQSKIVSAWKLRQSGIAQKCFESDHAAIGQLSHLRDVAGNQPAPQ